MKYLTSICIISGIVSNLLMTSCSKKFYFDSRTATKKDYIIRNQKVNFHFNDSVYPYLALIKPNGEFYIRKDTSDSSELKMTWYSAYNNTYYPERHILKNDSIIELYSYFPILITQVSGLKIKSILYSHAKYLLTCVNNMLITFN